MWSSGYWDATNISVSKLRFHGTLIVITHFQCEKFSWDSCVWWNPRCAKNAARISTCVVRMSVKRIWTQKHQPCPLSGVDFHVSEVLWPKLYIPCCNEKLIDKMWLYPSVQFRLPMTPLHLLGGEKKSQKSWVLPLPFPGNLSSAASRAPQYIAVINSFR